MCDVFQSSHIAADQLPAHRHSTAYGALVLDGTYSEASVDGRFECSAGVLTLHPTWHTHANEFGQGGAVVLNIPIPESDGLTSIRVSNPEALAALAHQKPIEAGLAALEEAEAHAPSAPAAWLSRLAASLAADDGTDIGELSLRCGVSPEHASRACKRWFGMSPSALRREGRLQHAMKLLRRGETPLVAALEAGFSDQPHLTRLLKRATGMTPAVFAAR